MACVAQTERALMAGAEVGCKAEQAGERGTSLEMDFEVQETVLGTGTNVIVRDARCRRSGRIDAVKTFQTSGMTRAEVSNMRSGCGIQSELVHPCIARVRGLYEGSAGEVHLVMEKLGGGELFDKIGKQGRLPVEEAAGVAVQLLRAAACMHARRLVHRDIKLGNIVCEEGDGRGITLIDFGYAARLDDRAAMGVRCGTLGYMAPEVVQGRPYGAAADMWSIGICLYTILTGRRAFHKQSRTLLLQKSRRGAVQYCQTFKRLPLEAQDLVRQLLTLDPTRRPNAYEALSHPWLTGALPAEAAAGLQEAQACGAHLLRKAPRAAAAGGGSASTACVQEVTCWMAMEYSLAVWHRFLYDGERPFLVSLGGDGSSAGCPTEKAEA